MSIEATDGELLALKARRAQAYQLPPNAVVVFRRKEFKKTYGRDRKKPIIICEWKGELRHFRETDFKI